MGASKQPVSHEHRRSNREDIGRQLKREASSLTYKSNGQVGEFPSSRDALLIGVRQNCIECCKIRANRKDYLSSAGPFV